MSGWIGDPVMTNTRWIWRGNITHLIRCFCVMDVKFSFAENEKVHPCHLYQRFIVISIISGIAQNTDCSQSVATPYKILPPNLSMISCHKKSNFAQIILPINCNDYIKMKGKILIYFVFFPFLTQLAKLMNLTMTRLYYYIISILYWDKKKP